MKIAIIGSNSLLATYIRDEFIAKGALLTLYGRKKDPYSLLSPGVNFVPFSYPDQPLDMDELADHDVIVYCAAAGVQANKNDDVSLTYEVNAFLPIKILNYLNLKGYTGKWFSFGSYFEIGNNNEDVAFEEIDVVCSSKAVPNHYCLSKRLLSRFICDSLIDFDHWHFILPTIYGSRENEKRLIPYIVQALKNDLPVQLSAGTQIRQYLHCTDAAKLVVQVSKGAYVSGVYNASDGTGIQIAGMVQTIFSLFNKDASTYLGTLNTRDESMKVLKLKATKIRNNIPHWKAEIGLAEGIKEYLV